MREEKNILLIAISICSSKFVDNSLNQDIKTVEKGSCLEITFHVTKNTKEVSCYNKVKMVTKETKVSYPLA